MKKPIAILLALVLVLSLCACKKTAPEADSTDTGSTNTTDTTDTTGSTDTTDTTDTTDSTETTDGTGDAAPDNSGDSNTNTNTNTTPTCTHDWKAATCTAPKTCSKCKATEGSAAGHSWKAATCTAPKTCSVCGATEGSKGSHTFTADCTICGQPNEGFVELGQSVWNYVAKTEEGLLEGEYIFFDSVAEQGVNVGFTILTSFEEFAKKYEMTVDQVREEYAGGEMHKTIDGVDYVYDGWGVDNWSDRRYKEENGVVTVEFLSLNWDNDDNKIWNVEQTVVMKRTGMAQMTVTSSNYESTPVGTVLTGEYFGS